MYLSKVSLQRSIETAKVFLELDSTGPYASHQLLWTLFTGEEARGFLFREELNSQGLPEFYILSKTPAEGDKALFNVQTKTFLPQICAGQRLSFKLRVNPTICITDKGKSKRHDVIMHAKHQAKEAKITDKDALNILTTQAAHRWIADEHRLAGWGVSLDVLPEIERYTQHRSLKGNKSKISFSSVDFQGVLTVIDPGLFLNQLQKGFGRSKALGCGLMLIRPI